MLRRRLFVVIGIISFAAGATAAASAPAGNLRKFFTARGAKIDCTDDPAGTTGSSLCRRARVIADEKIESLNSGIRTNTTTVDPETMNVEKAVIDDYLESTNGETALDEGRGKKKKGGLLRIFVLMAAAAKATLLYVKIHAVAFLAAKALVVAKVALALAAAVALKKALEHDKTSYEIVKHPHHSYSQSHSASVDYDHHGGYEGGHRRRRRAR